MNKPAVTNKGNQTMTFINIPANTAPHGQEGHTNVYILDQDSEITNFGKHNKLQCGKIIDCDYNSDFSVDEIFKHGLPQANEQDCKRIIKREWHNSKSHTLELCHSETWENNGCKIISRYFKYKAGAVQS